MTKSVAEYHECDQMQSVSKLLPNVAIAKDGDGWYMDVDRYAFAVAFCPFCGRELASISQALCGALGPYTGTCEREKDHAGEHRVGWHTR